MSRPPSPPLETASPVKGLTGSQWFTVGILLTAWLTGSWFAADYFLTARTQALLRDESREVETQADNTAKNIRLNLNYLHGIPSFFAKDETVLATVSRFDATPALMSVPAELRKEAWSKDATLKALSAELGEAVLALGADALFVITASGDCIASSNTNAPDSFIGVNLADRSYFQMARAGAQGYQYAMGRRSNIPGLFFSAPIFIGGQFAGVSVAKINLPNLAHWVNQSDAFISDQDGVIILAHDPSLEMRALPDAAVTRLAEADRLARYKRPTFPPLAIKAWGNPAFPGLRTLGDDPRPLLLSSRALPESGIVVHVFKHLPEVERFVAERRDLFLLFATTGTLLFTALIGRYVITRNRRQATVHTAQSLSLLHATIESTTDGILVIDNHRRVTTYNQRFVDLWGIPDDVLQSGDDNALLDSVIHQLEAPQLFLDKIQSLYDRPETSSLDVFRLRDGRVIERSSLPQRLGDEIVGRVWNFHDITERKLAEEKLAESVQMLRTIIETEPECVKVLAADGTVLQMNPAGLAMLEADSPDQVIGQKAQGIIAPGSRRAFATLTRQVFAGESGTLEFEVIGLKGAHRWLETHAVPMRDAQGQTTALLGITRDVTERRRSEEDLRIAACALEVEEGIFITNRQGVILRVNAAFTQLTGYSAEEAVGKTPALLRSGRQDADFYQHMREALAYNGKWQGEIWNRRKNGEIFPEWLTISSVRTPSGEITHYVAAFSDISLRKKAEDQIRHLAFYDPLTQLPNRRLLMDRLTQALASSARNHRHGALLFIDLDNFKTLNDTRGHDVGDLLLISVAERLLACVRDEDSVARLGGDEFVVMLDDLDAHPQTAATQVRAVAEKIRSTLNQPYTLKGREHHSTPSIGISLFLGHAEPVDELLKQADVAMYQAKDAGRNAVCFFDPAMQAILDARTAMEADLRHAQRESQLALHYQVQVNGDGRVVGAEALLRWNHPERGLVAPARFIPLAEETGLIIPIGLWVLETVCKQLKLWDSEPATAGLHLSVNVSARQFQRPDFAEQVREVLERTGANPARLKFELTESLLLDDIADGIAKMQTLKVLGVGFSIDDFGTGYSSLSYLKRLPINQLKVDQSFVHELATDPDDAAIVRAIIDMARQLGLDVIAEGVETEEQRAFLVGSGCTAFQGYLFGRPLPLAEIEALLHRA